jgi:hypothetical protein
VNKKLIFHSHKAGGLILSTLAFFPSLKVGLAHSEFLEELHRNALPSLNTRNHEIKEGGIK